MDRKTVKLLKRSEWKILQQLLDDDKAVSALKYFRSITGMGLVEADAIVTDFHENGLPKANILGWLRSKVSYGN